MRTFIVCLSQGGTDTFEICFNLFTPPLSGCSIRVRAPMDALRHRCTFYMSYSIYNTDICLYSDAPKHLAVSYHLPPPLFLLRDSNHESCQREKHSYLHILHPYSYSIITTASLKRAFILLDNPHIIGCWNSGAEGNTHHLFSLYFSFYP